jgi:hypothetical protein
MPRVAARESITKRAVANLPPVQAAANPFKFLITPPSLFAYFSIFRCETRGPVVPILGGVILPSVIFLFNV